MVLGSVGSLRKVPKFIQKCQLTVAKLQKLQK